MQPTDGGSTNFEVGDIIYDDWYPQRNEYCLILKIEQNVQYYVYSLTNAKYGRVGYITACMDYVKVA
jgi:hypothetical protein